MDKFCGTDNIFHVLNCNL